MTNITLREAREVARQVELGLMRAVPRRNPDFDKVRAAFHRLDMSDPATVELRNEDRRLAKVIFKAAGFHRPQHIGVGE